MILYSRGSQPFSR